MHASAGAIREAYHRARDRVAITPTCWAPMPPTD